MKSFLNGLTMILSQFIMWMPIHFIRWIFLKLLMKSIGTHTEFCRNLDIRSPHRVSVGSNTTINKRALIDGRGGELKIGNCVDIAQEAQIWTLQHDYNSPCYAAVGKPVSIGDYAWIGTRAIILPGVNVGEGVVVAAGAVVTKDIEPYTVVAGVPAKKITERQRSLSYKLGKWRWFQ